MEQVERLEQLVERCNQCELEECINCEICWSEVKEIEKLLKRYKEKFIPISVIQNKIDELDNNAKDKTKEFYYANYRYCKNILQEILVERSK